jgi:hypothetical protein
MSEKNTRSGHSPLVEGGEFPYRKYPDTISESGAEDRLREESDSDPVKSDSEKPKPVKYLLTTRRGSVAAPYAIPKRSIVAPSRLKLFNTPKPTPTPKKMDPSVEPVQGTSSDTRAADKAAAKAELDKQMRILKQQHQDELGRVAAQYQQQLAQLKTQSNLDRNQSRSVGNLSTDEGNGVPDKELYSMFLHLAKPITNLNNPEKRDDGIARARNTEHINAISKHAVKAALDGSMAHILKQMDSDRQEIRNRFDALEKMNALQGRVATEKKGALRPLLLYPDEDEEADEPTFRDAAVVMEKGVRVIEKRTAFYQEPWNYQLELCMLSNKIAASHELSMDQQMDLVMRHVPTTSAEYAIIEKCDNLLDLFAIVSQFSSRILTASEIEQQIQVWKLDTSSQKALDASLASLISLFSKLLKDDQGEYNLVDCFERIVSRILNERLPFAVTQYLNECRFKFKATSTMRDLTELLLGGLKRLVTWKNQTQTKAIVGENVYSEDLVHQHNMSNPAISHMLPQIHPAILGPAPAQLQSVQNLGATPKKKKKKSKVNAVAQNGAQNLTQGQNQQQTNRYGNNTPRAQPSGSKHTFVEQWPMGKNYKMGSGLSREFNEFFRNHCFRCGHSSHQARECKIYTERTPIMSLCGTCRQGMHEKCKSRRYGPNANANQMRTSEHSLQAQQNVVKVLTELFQGGLARNGYSQMGGALGIQYGE